MIATGRLLVAVGAKIFCRYGALGKCTYPNQAQPLVVDNFEHGVVRSGPLERQSLNFHGIRGVSTTESYVRSCSLYSELSCGMVGLRPEKCQPRSPVKLRIMCLGVCNCVPRRITMHDRTTRLAVVPISTIRLAVIAVKTQDVTREKQISCLRSGLSVKPTASSGDSAVLFTRSFWAAQDSSFRHHISEMWMKAMLVPRFDDTGERYATYLPRAKAILIFTPDVFHFGWVECGLLMG